MNNPAHIGFTGTRQGMTSKQLRSLRTELEWFRTDLVDQPEFHHGGCVGADYEAHVIAVSLGFKVVVHPGRVQPKYVAHLRNNTIHRRMVVQDPIKRNRNIVNGAYVVIVAPKELQEVQRSGTWATERYALCKLKDVPEKRPEYVLHIDPFGHRGRISVPHPERAVRKM